MKPLLWIAEEIDSPPFGESAKSRATAALNIVCMGEVPHGAKALPVVGRQCLEIRINDRNRSWRIILYTSPDAVVVLDVFEKKTQRIPNHVISSCKKRLRDYLATR